MQGVGGRISVKVTHEQLQKRGCDLSPLAPGSSWASKASPPSANSLHVTDVSRGHPSFVLCALPYISVLCVMNL